MLTATLDPQGMECLNQPHPRAKLNALGSVALEQWKRHFLNGHMPARRDCAHCVRAQARSKPHRRVHHPESYTLSVDMSGRLSPGDDQQAKGCKYIMVGCFTYPVTLEGRSLLPVPGQPDPDQDQPLPALDVELDETPEDDAAVLPEDDVEIEADDDSLCLGSMQGSVHWGFQCIASTATGPRSSAQRL
eukprot:s1851_g15.t1